LLIDDRTGQQMYAQAVPGLAGCFSPQGPGYANPPNPYSAPQNPYIASQTPYNTPQTPYGVQTPYGAAPDPYGNAYPRPMYPVGVSPKSKVVALVLAFFLGFLGVHRFYLGHQSTGAVMLALTLAGLCICPVGPIVAGIWAFVDMILIATDSLIDASGQRLS
jgi:TM2 domain-containing membrane protein YozV